MKNERELYPNKQGTLSNAVSNLGRRCRRWASTEQTLCQCLAFAGIDMSNIVPVASYNIYAALSYFQYRNTSP